MNSPSDLWQLYRWRLFVWCKPKLFLSSKCLNTQGACCNVRACASCPCRMKAGQSCYAALGISCSGVKPCIMEVKGCGSYRGHMWGHSQSLALSGNPLVSSEVVFSGHPEGTTKPCIVWMVRRRCPKGTSENAVIGQSRCNH